MRCFTVHACRIEEGLPFAAEPYPHIPVGEEGRGRELVRFPVGRNFAEALSLGEAFGKRPAQITKASLIKTKQKGTLLLVEERDPDDPRALVLVCIPAGYRGSTTWSGIDYKEVPCPNRGRPAAYYRCPECGEDYPAARDSSLFWTDQNIHPDSGTVKEYEAFPPPGVTVIAEGWCAQGAAGRMGGHAERLIIMEPGSAIRVVRHGRLYGDPAERFVLWTGQELRLGTRDEVWPPVDDEEGELM